MAILFLLWSALSSVSGDNCLITNLQCPPSTTNSNSEMDCPNAQCEVSDCCTPKSCYEWLSDGSISQACVDSGRVLMYQNNCNMTTCEDCCISPSCQDMILISPYLCQPDGQLFASDRATFDEPCPSSSCDADRCCRDAVTCGEYETITNICTAYRKVTIQDKPCTGSDCQPEYCCRQPQSCAEHIQAGTTLCSVDGFTFNDQDPQLQEMCPGGVCTAERCCRRTTTCEEADKSIVDPRHKLSVQCHRQELVLAPNSVCSYPENCTNVCCTPPSSCQEYAETGSACPDPTHYLDIYAPSFPFNVADCCQPPTSCYQVPCGPFQRSNSGSCEGASCTAANCCEDVTSCWDINLPTVCIASDLVPNSYGQCSGSCDVAACCREPTCSDFASYISCAPFMRFAYETTCGDNCTAAFCCQPANTCYDVDSSSLCEAAGLVAESRGDICGPNCNISTCCVKHRCLDALRNSPINCEPFEALDYNRQCEPGECSTEVCCKPVEDCWEFNDLEDTCHRANMFPLRSASCSPYCNITTCCTSEYRCEHFFEVVGFLGCPARGLFPRSERPCNEAECSLDICCGATTSCAEADLLEMRGLCAGVGVLTPNVACSGAECTQSVCCAAPHSCEDVVNASTWSDSDSLFCAHDGFADKFDSTICGDKCTSASCCRAITTCNEWNQTLIKSGLKKNHEVCSNGYLDPDLPCENGICDEQSCCRPPVKCGETRLFCGEFGVIVPNQPCSGSGCNATTCCKKPTTCYEDLSICRSIGQVNTRSMSTCNGSVCTVEECCYPATNCYEVKEFTSCPVGSVFNFTSCDGPCNVEKCCTRAPACGYILTEDLGFCKDMFVNFSAGFKPCPAGGCTPEFCCRSNPVTCGEAASRTPALCGGAVDYFKPCTGTQCTDAEFCCRPPVNCRESLGSGNLTCDAGWVPNSLNQPACPDGVCTTAYCCKKVNNCRDANAAANGGLCAPPAIVNHTVCGGALEPPCDSATCCRDPLTCAEATDASSSFCPASRPIVNQQAVETLCVPNGCSVEKCCRTPEYCAEAYSIDSGLCDSQGKAFNFSASSTKCSDCATQCCVARATFAPSPLPPSPLPPSPLPPSPLPPTTSPTPKSTNCPNTAIRAVLEACKASDFRPPHTGCTVNCKTSAEALVAAFAPPNVTSASVCLDEVLASFGNLTTTDRAYVVKQLQEKAPLCVSPTVNSAFMVSYSLSALVLLMIAVY